MELATGQDGGLYRHNGSMRIWGTFSQNDLTIMEFTLVRIVSKRSNDLRFTLLFANKRFGSLFNIQ